MLILLANLPAVPTDDKLDTVAADADIEASDADMEDLIAGDTDMEALPAGPTEHADEKVAKFSCY